MKIKQQLFITTGGIFLLVLLVSIGIIVPKIRSIQTIRTTIYDTQKQLETQHNRSIQLKKTLRELNDAKAFAKEISDSTLAENAELQIITQLEELALQHDIDQTLDIEIQEVTKNSVENVGAYTRADITSMYVISLLNKATLENHMAYLSSVETQLPYYLHTSAISFAKPQTQQEQDQEMIHLRLRGHIFISDESSQ